MFGKKGASWRSARNPRSGAADWNRAPIAITGQLGKTIQRLRKAYNLSLSDLAEQSGVAKSIISQIERNETNPTLATVWRLSQALDVTVERVLASSTRRPFVEKLTAPTRPCSSRRTACAASPSSVDQDGGGVANIYDSPR